jgi:signal transduction histidine kinase
VGKSVLPSRQAACYRVAQMTRVSGFFMVWLVLAHAHVAAETGWDEKLAERFSSRLREIQEQLAAVGPKLEKLPGIPIDDQGGTGGYAGIYPAAEPSGNDVFAVEVRWQEATRVEMIALVPARRYDAKGLDARYGVPDAFTVDLIDGDGAVVRQVADERGGMEDAVRGGHPFVYQISPPVEAAGLRISARRLNPDYEEEGTFVHAWAEVEVFSETGNVSHGAGVKGVGGGNSAAPWHWNPGFLVDGETPLGLPEVPAEHGNVGWISEGRATANEVITLEVDLGNSKTIDAVRLLPAKRPTSDLPSGFGFPRALRISVSEDGAERSWKPVAEREMANPGHNPVLFPFEPTTARYVKIEATELWKEFADYPAFFALSEVEVLAGQDNLALGKPVRSSDGMLNLTAPGGRFWSTAALSDGFGPDGRLVSDREWMTLLDERYRLERLRHELGGEAAQRVGQWRRAGQTGMVLLGVAGAFLLIVLPIHYRIQANRELVKVRERIAGDLHDEVGSNLGSIQMIADLAEGRSGPSDELKRIQRIAAETVSAVRDIVWLLRPSGDHRIGTAEHLRETASIMLETLDWKFTANEPAWDVELPEESNRDLFLYYREALHNIMRHAKAAKVSIHVEKQDGHFKLVIGDDGVGIAAEKRDRPSTMRALRQRAVALDADFNFESEAGAGTRLTLVVPLERKRKRVKKVVEPVATEE